MGANSLNKILADSQSYNCMDINIGNIKKTGLHEHYNSHKIDLSSNEINNKQSDRVLIDLCRSSSYVPVSQ
jgi:hypothetical protein